MLDGGSLILSEPAELGPGLASYSGLAYIIYSSVSSFTCLHSTLHNYYEEYESSTARSKDGVRVIREACKCEPINMV